MNNTLYPIRLHRHPRGIFWAMAAAAIAVLTGTAFGGLVAHYRFDNSLNDETGNHNATLRDPLEVPLYDVGKIGQAVLIDSPGTSLEAANPGTIELSQEFSIAAWVNTIASGERCLIYKGNPSAWVTGNKQFNLYGGGDLGANGLFFHTQGQGAFGTSF
jgi:hypothetical protein